MTSSSVGNTLTAEFIPNYFDYLISQFYKILPMTEEKDETLAVYLDSFKNELIGFSSVARIIEYDARFVSIVSVVQFIIDNPEAEHKVIKREIFKAINICQKLASKYKKAV